jgi:hypothetical protein
MLTSVVSHYPALAPIHNFILLFLPPCGPYLTPLSTGSLKSGLLVSSLLGGPARHRPFAPTLHLHQRKSSRNLHLQYSAKSQSTPRCQSLITARSDHPPVLERSGPQLFTTAPLVGCDTFMGNSTNSSCEFFIVTRSHMEVSVESIITYRMAGETLHSDFAKTFDFRCVDLQ